MSLRTTYTFPVTPPHPRVTRDPLPTAVCRDNREDSIQTNFGEAVMAEFAKMRGLPLAA
jgi:hypothetical protein